MSKQSKTPAIPATAPTDKPKRKPFRPDWGQIRALVRVVSVHCEHVAAELEITRQTLDKHCKAVFGKSFRIWAREVRKVSGLPPEFSLSDYKALLYAFYGGGLAYQDRTAQEQKAHIKSVCAPLPGGPTTGESLTQRFTMGQVGRVLQKLYGQDVSVGGVLVPCPSILSVWLEPKRQRPDILALFEWTERNDGEWRFTPAGASAIGEAVVLFHRELDKQLINPPQNQ